jgi:hypothetical protein
MAESGWLPAMLAFRNLGIQLPVFSLLFAVDVEHYQYSEIWLW